MDTTNAGVPELRLDLNYIFSTKTIISFLIFLCPFTMGSFPILSFNYLVISFGCTILLFLISGKELYLKNYSIQPKLKISVLIFLSSVFLSFIFGLDYRNTGGFTDFKSDFDSVFLDTIWIMFIQVSLIYMIYISIKNIEEILFYLKVFLISGVIVNIISLYYLKFTNLEQGRLGGTFQDPNYLGRFEIFIIVLSFAYIILKKYSYLIKLGLIFNAFVSFMILFYSFSRSALITLGISTFVFLWFTKSKKLIVTGLFLLVVCFVIILNVTSTKRSDISQNSIGDSGIESVIDLSNTTRIALNISSFYMFLDHPIVGVGYRNFYNVYINNSYLPFDIPVALSVSVVHSWFFSTMAELGIMGLASICWFFYLLFSNLRRIVKMARTKINSYNDNLKFSAIVLYVFLFILLFNGMFFPIFYSELLFSVLIGLILGVIKVAGSDERK